MLMLFAFITEGGRLLQAVVTLNVMRRHASVYFV